MDKDVESNTASMRAIALDSDTVCEFLEKGVHEEFSLLQAGNNPLVTVTWSDDEWGTTEVLGNFNMVAVSICYPVNYMLRL